jgi:hypothetical protein
MSSRDVPAAMDVDVDEDVKFELVRAPIEL